jgi:DNA helicase-2/ATP-dependent DNA helicase PcrA
MQKSLFPKNTFSEQDNQSSGRKKTIRRGDLNPSQYEAVTYLDGPLLVVAGAGSGKTRTLVYRVAHLLELGILPENLLLLTFTRRAAQEMLWRASLAVAPLWIPYRLSPQFYNY